MSDSGSALDDASRALDSPHDGPDEILAAPMPGAPTDPAVGAREPVGRGT